MELTPDAIVLFEWGPVRLSATIVATWVVMAILGFGAYGSTRKLSRHAPISRKQNLLEVLLIGVGRPIREVAPSDWRELLPFVASLFLFIATCNLLAVVPFFPPTGSLSTTAALALCVFIAVPIFGIRRLGWRRYLSHYLHPTPLMLPFNVLGELTRTVALAVRLFGNVMSGTMIGAVLLSVVPLLFPIAMQLLGILTGLVQAYVFAVLALIYLTSGLQVVASEPPEDPSNHPNPGASHG